MLKDVAPHYCFDFLDQSVSSKAIKILIGSLKKYVYNVLVYLLISAYLIYNTIMHVVKKRTYI